MGFLSPAHINITILDHNSADPNEESLEERVKRLSASSSATHASAILAELRQIQRKQQNSNIQVSIQEVAAILSMPSAKLLDSLIWCEKFKIIRIWRKRSIPTHSEWLYPLTFDAGKGLKEA